ncbi:MIP/aquaporin family protein [Tepidimicrobium xylanilyticum]|uniref:Glycerol uptake facilitator protein n=1 Tax=Tepidimicrobium xylanilyticum TaxID=1123352 RepID=A0A1H3BAY2_9FIRM|nr:MIP/aquaporin family protein [Tepidimicrobium xylanilyticum]GMG96949.1 putative glycerol uptake facilitator protein [Tepidimicrobium xylanilyticum]SDX39112.1 glycerol uptake facilitator protein [Tepidimicrobium xylanilyticum]
MSNMGMYFGEFFGTMLLILLGDGVVANVVLKDSKGNNSGWIVITTAWGLAVAVAAYTTGWVSGAHLNPALTIGFAAIGNISWSLVPGYIVAQLLGAFVGAVLVYLTYKDHFAATEDKDAKLGVFCTAPAIRNKVSNMITEIIGTAMLAIGILGINHMNNGVGALSALLAGFLVWSIGLSLGGPTGYAINPARDLGPRIAHAILPISGKRDSDWGYALIPVIGPVIGGVLGAYVYQLFLSLWV